MLGDLLRRLFSKPLKMKEVDQGHAYAFFQAMHGYSISPGCTGVAHLFSRYLKSRFGFRPGEVYSPRVCLTGDSNISGLVVRYLSGLDYQSAIDHIFKILGDMVLDMPVTGVELDIASFTYAGYKAKAFLIISTGSVASRKVFYARHGAAGLIEADAILRTVILKHYDWYLPLDESYLDVRRLVSAGYPHRDIDLSEAFAWYLCIQRKGVQLFNQQAGVKTCRVLPYSAAAALGFNDVFEGIRTLFFRITDFVLDVPGAAFFHVQTTGMKSSLPGVTLSLVVLNKFKEQIHHVTLHCKPGEIVTLTDTDFDEACCMSPVTSPAVCKTDNVHTGDDSKLDTRNILASTMTGSACAGDGTSSLTRSMFASTVSTGPALEVGVDTTSTESVSSASVENGRDFVAWTPSGRHALCIVMSPRGRTVEGVKHQARSPSGESRAYNLSEAGRMLLWKMYVQRKQGAHKVCALSSLTSAP